MESRKKYVMFGFGGLFGDLVDIIHLNGGALKKVVLNVPEVPQENRISLQERLSRIPYPVEVAWLADFLPQQEDERYLFGFKGPQIAPLREALKGDFSLSFENLIHPAAVLSPTALLGEGCVINAGAIIGSNTELGDHVFLNRGATVGHDVRIRNYVFIGPNATVCGQVFIEEGSSIFANATVIERKRVGAYAQIAAGAVCLTDVPPKVLMVGVPAREKKSVDLSESCLYLGN